MNEKSFRKSALSAAVVSTLAICAAVLPGNAAFAKSGLRAQGAKGTAIIGTGADAIIGTGADAIIGTGADAIIGTGADAIIGTGADAIIGTGADAIIGTGADAIIGTGADAIIGTGSDRFVVVKGPVEKVNMAAGSLTIFGRKFSVPASSGLLNQIEQATASGNCVEVLISARFDAAGKLSGTTARVFIGQYVPGVSEVVLTDRVTSVDRGAGRIALGTNVVDYNQLLATRQVDVAVGAIVTVTGTQPQSGQGILAGGLKIRSRQ